MKNLMRIDSVSTIVLLLLGLSATGCTSHQMSFKGHDPDAVWKALVMTAQSPDYDDMEPAYRWDVRENEVWVDPATGRIEIYRRLHRTVTKPVKLKRTEDREWSFHVSFDPDPAPSAMFDCRQSALPAWVQAEADRYFASVMRLLEGMDAEVDMPALPETQPAPPETQPSEVETELEELLEPDGAESRL